MKPMVSLGFLVVGLFVLVTAVHADDKTETTYTVDLKITGYRAKAKNERNIMMQGLLGRLIPYPNPTVYTIVKIESVGAFLIPRLEKEAEGRTVRLSFSAPKNWIGKDIILEVWEDNNNSDNFWKAVLASTEVTAHANTPALFPIDAGATIRIKTDKQELKNVTLISDRPVGQFYCKVPEPGKTVEVPVYANMAPTLLLGLNATLPLGKAEWKTKAD